MVGHQGLRYLKNLNDLNDLDLNDRIEYFCFKDLQ